MGQGSTRMVRAKPPNDADKPNWTRRRLVTLKMRTYTRNSDSAYDSLSRCSLDSLSGYIDDDYDNNLLGDTKINVDKVNSSEQEN